MSFETPVLLLAWRRADTTKQVIDAIRPMAPTRMFVACDGARAGYPEEAARVRECRELIDREIDWPCTVERHYQESNLGCRVGVGEALNWYFECVEEGIVLEDDCVPHADFFGFCAELLERYRDDTRVWCISGDNYQDGQWRGDGSYYFSRYNHVWGWASWRRRWQHHDAEMRSWPALKASGLLATIFEDPLEEEYWTRIWTQLAERGEPDTWDYQWSLTCMSNGGLTALPNRNLVLNVGFGEQASHTPNESYYRQQPMAGIQPLSHPSFVLRDRVADAYSFEHHFHGSELRQRPSPFVRWSGRVRMAARHPLYYPLKAWRRIAGRMQ